MAWAEEAIPARSRPDTVSFVDREWDELREDIAHVAPAEEADRVVDYIEQANRLRRFRTEHPKHGAAGEARRLEALALLYAAYAGDESQKARRDQLVAEVRQDLTLDAERRCEVAAFAENLAVDRLTELPTAVRIEEYERVARMLLMEFPEVAVCYESLLGLAMSKPGMAGLPTARELVENPATPAPIRAAASRFIARCSLVGRSLADIAKATLPEDTPLESTRGKASLLYAWSSRDREATIFITRLIAQAPPETEIVGFNLDAEVEAAKQFEREFALPGEQIYRTSGAGAVLHEALKIGEAPLIYVTDREGVIQSVTGLQDMSVNFHGEVAQ